MNEANSIAKTDPPLKGQPSRAERLAVVVVSTWAATALGAVITELLAEGNESTVDLAIPVGIAGALCSRAWTSRRSALPTLWLLMNCLVAAFYTEIFLSSMAFPPSPVGILLTLTWLGLLPVVLVLAVLRGRPAYRLASTAIVLVGALLAWNGWHIGHCVRVWRQEGWLLQVLHEAMATQQTEPSCGPRFVEVDRGDNPPVRAAIYWLASHGDVNGVVYDPTREVERKEKARAWLYGARAQHLFGPWYMFGN
ncbi:MAG TPA: hypothetical protein VF128_16135 [Gemmatimonadaceae bacterium]